jgi:hypothetical protein
MLKSAGCVITELVDVMFSELMVFIRHLLKFSLVFLTDLSFGPYCLMYLLTTFAILLNT